MIDIQGKTIMTWNAATIPVITIAFPINRTAGGMYLMRVTDAAAGHATLRVAVP
jgi:hypothetical protein